MLAAPLWRDVRHRPFQHLQERLLDPLAGDVPGDRNVVAGLADLVDLVDVDNPALGGFQVEVGGVQKLQEDVLDVLADVAGLRQRGCVADRERDVEDSGHRLGQQRLAAAGRADQQDVRLVELDLAVALLAVDQPLVVVVDGDREHLLGAILADHVLIELFLDLARRGDIGEERLGDAPTPTLLIEDRLAEFDALAADVDVPRPFDERADVAITLAAERAIGVLLRPAGRAGRRVTPAAARSAAATSTARSAAARVVLARWHARSLMQWWLTGKPQNRSTRDRRSWVGRKSVGRGRKAVRGLNSTDAGAKRSRQTRTHRRSRRPSRELTAPIRPRSDESPRHFSVRGRLKQADDGPVKARGPDPFPDPPRSARLDGSRRPGRAGKAPTARPSPPRSGPDPGSARRPGPLAKSP